MKPYKITIEIVKRWFFTDTKYTMCLRRVARNMKEAMDNMQAEFEVYGRDWLIRTIKDIVWVD